ncbi:MAG: translation initiation factor IF-3 [Candidatus Muiribacteriaceae bacterium]
MEVNSINKLDYRVNEKIRANEVRLINNDGSQAGIVPLPEAIEKAADEGLDLVEIAPKAKPPVCRIIDYSKFRYEQKKKEKEAKKKQKTVTVKEIRLFPNIEDHDLEVKVNKAVKFLEKGDKVRFNLRFRGRQHAHRDLGIDLLDRVEEMLSEYGKAEKNINHGKRIFRIEITPFESK